jgi:hypothetical protein
MLLTFVALFCDNTAVGLDNYCARLSQWTPSGQSAACCSAGVLQRTPVHCLNLMNVIYRVASGP